MIPVNNRFEEIKHYILKQKTTKEKLPLHIACERDTDTETRTDPIRTRSWYKNHETLLELREKIQDLAHNKEDQEDLLCSRTSTATF